MVGILHNETLNNVIFDKRQYLASISNTKNNLMVDTEQPPNTQIHSEVKSNRKSRVINAASQFYYDVRVQCVNLSALNPHFYNGEFMF